MTAPADRCLPVLQELLRLQALVEEHPKDATTILQTELPKALSTALPTLQASSCLPVPCHLANAVHLAQLAEF